MQRFFASKLYYKIFPYKITFERTATLSNGKKQWGNGWTPQKCVKWIDQKNWAHRIKTKISVKKRIKQVSVTMNLYLETRQAFDSCMQKYSKYITNITAPHDDSHIDLLKNNNHIVIRKNLLYKKFRYVVNFRRTWHTPIDDIDDWMQENYAKLMHNGHIKWVSNGYNPRVYLANEEDLVFVKLTWGERIREITTIHLLAEL
jgi:hypothetical protein